MLIFLMLTLITFMVLMSKMMKMLMVSPQRESISPFECGFDPNHKTRSPFSLRFFMITVLFLIFDVELTIMLPIPISLSWDQAWSLIMNSAIFTILLMGLLMEWSQKALNWQ